MLPAGRPDVLRDLQFGELETRRNGATYKRVVAKGPRRLPVVRRHDALRTLAVCNGRSKHVSFGPTDEIALEKKLERRACIRVPNLGRINAMPSGDLTAAKEKIDRCRESAAVWSGRIAKRLPEVSALGMRCETEFCDETIRLAHSAENVTLSG